jgi:hypothetical protein
MKQNNINNNNNNKKQQKTDNTMTRRKRTNNDLQNAGSLVFCVVTGNQIMMVTFCHMIASFIIF